MDNVRKPSNSECHTLSSEQFRIYLFSLSVVQWSRYGERHVRHELLTGTLYEFQATGGSSILEHLSRR
jgi:hypothetical protein